MTPTRRPPHCRTCHKPLKGHKRGICEATDVDADTTPPPSPAPSARRSSRKSTPQPLQPLPTLSPQSSEILNNILRTNSYSAPPVRLPQVRQSMPGAFLGSPLEPAESLHADLDHLELKEKVAVLRDYTPTEGSGSETSEPGGVTPPVPKRVSRASTILSETTSSYAVSQQLGIEAASSRTSAPGPRTRSAAARLKRSQHSSTHSSASGVPPDDATTIQNFLDSISQSSRHPPATIFSFPRKAVASLEDGARRLGLFVHVLAMPASNDEWVPVVVGRDEDAISKLLEDSEKLAQSVKHSGSMGARLGMSHVVVGTLGALATWAGLAYT